MLCKSGILIDIVSSLHEPKSACLAMTTTVTLENYNSVLTCLTRPRAWCTVGRQAVQSVKKRCSGHAYWIRRCSKCRTSPSQKQGAYTYPSNIRFKLLGKKLKFAYLVIIKVFCILFSFFKSGGVIVFKLYNLSAVLRESIWLRHEDLSYFIWSHY